MYDVKHSGTEVSNYSLFLSMTWGYLIYKPGSVTSQKCSVSICRQYFGMSGVRPWADLGMAFCLGIFLWPTTDK